MPRSVVLCAWVQQYVVKFNKNEKPNPESVDIHAKRVRLMKGTNVLKMVACPCICKVLGRGKSDNVTLRDVHRTMRRHWENEC